MNATSRGTLGPGAAVRKYDLLTALALTGLDNVALSERLALRLIALVTARYDWPRDCVTVGHEELMRLWAVSKRTVIRDLDKLRSLGLLVLLEPGRRGRVARYRLDHRRLDAMTESSWERAGRAFSGRMRAEDPPQHPAPSTTVPSESVSSRSEEGPWARVKADLAPKLAPAAMRCWIDPLRFAELTPEALRLLAPSKFHADYVDREFGLKIEASITQALAGARRAVVEPLEAKGR